MKSTMLFFPVILSNSIIHAQNIFSRKRMDQDRIANLNLFQRQFGLRFLILKAEPDEACLLAAKHIMELK